MLTVVYLEKSCPETDILFRDFFGPVDNGGAGRARHSQVVGLAKTSDDGDAVLHQKVLSQVGNALLSDDLKEIKFET